MASVEGSVLVIPYCTLASARDTVRNIEECIPRPLKTEVYPVVSNSDEFEEVVRRIEQDGVDQKIVAVVMALQDDFVFAEGESREDAETENRDVLFEFLLLIGELRKNVMTVVFSEFASTRPSVRLALASKYKCHMVTHVTAHLTKSLTLLAGERQEGAQGTLACPVCGKPNLTPEQLWHHIPQFHVNSKKSLTMRRYPCPICGECGRDSLAVHVHERHPPAGVRVECGRSMPPAVAFGLCVIRRKSDGKFLVVQEYENQGYWLPGGGIDAAEMPDAAAKRECVEEAGIDVNLTGLLRVEVSPHAGYLRLRYIFFGTPVSEDQPCKTFPDFESVGACWVGIEDLDNPSIKWRGSEPHHWFSYIANGGIIPPISLLANEGAAPVMHQLTSL